MDLDELAADAAKQYRTTPTMVADILREAILAGALKGGQPLRQEDLATKFRLSRGPVREALRQLEGEGLITFSPHRGAVVSELSLAEVQEICDIRIALETAALRFAIPHLSEDVLKRAEEILDEADQQTTEVAHWGEINWKFHATLYAPANRPRLLSLIKAQHAQMDRYVRVHFSLMNYKQQAQQEHWQILDACKRRDISTALAVLERQIAAVGEMLASHLQQERSENGRSRTQSP
ncbi:MAG TPA: GntR family transcriptional regulator [Ktedonobacteraceae bacterium]|nr:GntR family transcriptional regulator [Ktedonobacteraceae bacterium]